MSRYGASVAMKAERQGMKRKNEYQPQIVDATPVEAADGAALATRDGAMLAFLFGDRGDANPDFESAFLEATEMSEIEQEIEVHQGFKKTAKSSAERAESEQIIATLEGQRALLIGPEMGNKRVGQIAGAGPATASSVKALGLSTREIAQTFEGLYEWRAEQWTKNLSSSKWLHPARNARGAAGGATAMWNPLTLAQLLHGREKNDKKNQKLMAGLRARFKQMPLLSPWSDDLNEYCDTYVDAN